MRGTIEERFWAKVQKGEGCWTWTASHLKGGYGTFYSGSKTVRASRLAYEWTGGAVPPGLKVCHTCDNPACVRNDEIGWYEVNGVICPRRGHLWLGTQVENAADMLNKGRHVATYGEAVNTAKLNGPKVAEIRELFATGLYTKTSLGERFGVSRSQIYQVVAGRSWRSYQEIPSE